eukprot:CAMPEP_0201138998 /NCGR_PEP_ID=MMETSP0851-20130426/265_1 /ASSEMBLY_ACC=CAM_ASM_000631 /TAXON_ID=183588 /ORGANISM="Pseudo-nitzschia fraudulenta, Strain WWA7" /LENGTH=95 /DNA_ID=CAMNT_0047410553 /DNA_START=275 /DNA_END=559 /DNA_ORIENTATION=+
MSEREEPSGVWNGIKAIEEKNESEFETAAEDSGEEEERNIGKYVTKVRTVWKNTEQKVETDSDSDSDSYSDSDKRQTTNDSDSNSDSDSDSDSDS